MSADEQHEDAPDYDARPDEIIDEEGSVDKAIKRRIIQARERVDETELALYRDATVDPNVSIGEAEKVHIYGTTVKQFLRRIEPILASETIEDSAHYYEEKTIDTITLVPPDTGGYQFSLVATDMGERELRKAIGLPRGVDIPQPETVEINGLEDVIEMDTVIYRQWTVVVENEGSPPNWKRVHPSVQRPLPKRVYEEAIRDADGFLQQAGIGVEIDSDPVGHT